jgi:hypothetical protein
MSDSFPHSALDRTGDIVYFARIVTFFDYYVMDEGRRQ